MFLLVGPSQTLGAITKAKFSPPDAAAPVVGERGLDGTVRSQLQCAVRLVSAAYSSEIGWSFPIK